MTYHDTVSCTSIVSLLYAMFAYLEHDVLCVCGVVTLYKLYVRPPGPPSRPTFSSPRASFTHHCRCKVRT